MPIVGAMLPRGTKSKEMLMEVLRPWCLPEGHSVPLQPGFASNLINAANLESMYRIKKGFIYLSDAHSPGT